MRVFCIFCRLFLLALVCAVSGVSGVSCSTAGNEANRIAAKFKFPPWLLEGQGFVHFIVQNSDIKSSKTVHVYIEGDGRPWIRRRKIADDPTPDTLLMLELMALDPTPSVYLGRPCYHGRSEDANCQNEFWTSKRYSQPVVDSMVAALSKLVNEQQSLILIGHSGGGTLAMLLAARLPQVITVVTIAGNLDPDAWVRLHGITPLYGSLNPSTLPPLASNIKQLHIAGGEDAKVPARLIETAIRRQNNARYVLFPKQHHTCCWKPIWPAVLLEINE